MYLDSGLPGNAIPASGVGALNRLPGKGTSIVCLALLTALSRFSFGQTLEHRQFEVASVKPARETSHAGGNQAAGRMTPITGSPEREAHGRVELSGATMQALIQRAFGLKPYQITGPNWLQDARYDIVAKLPEDASQDDIPEMLQTLLADRFRLAAHHSRELRPVYRLVAGKGGVKMQPVKDPTGRLRVSLGSQARRVAGTVTMVNLIHILAESVDRPIEDGTGLEGSFNVSIEWALADGALDADGSPLPTVFSALQERLGLRLEPHEMPLAVLVVDHLERQPTAN